MINLRFSCIFLAVTQLYAATESVLFSFDGSDGQAPYFGLTPGAAGTFYGATNLGGANGYGAVFKLTNSHGVWTETVLFSFDVASGAYPPGGVVRDSSTGVIYGLTSSGGANGVGTAYALTPSGAVWTISTFDFSSSGGTFPVGGLYLSPSGDLFGSTMYGGASGQGEVFKLIPPANGGWTDVPIYSFAGGRDGANGTGTLINYRGKLYGTTFSPGANQVTNPGTVYSLERVNQAWVHTVLHRFPGTGGDGAWPTGLTIDARGNLYGTAYAGGSITCYCGIVFELSPPAMSGGAWTESILYTFLGGSDGGEPAAQPTLMSDGALLGTATGGGTHNSGVVYHLVQSMGTWSETVAYSFAGGSDGQSPYAPLTAVSGVVYGTTVLGGGGPCTIGINHGCGVLFSLTP